MRVIDLLSADAIEINASVNSKEQAIDRLVSLHEKAGDLSDSSVYKREILRREAQSTTAIGDGIAVPHAKSESVKKASLALITVRDGVDYNAPDSKRSDIIFMIAAPPDGDLHLEILSRLMVMLMDKEFCDAVRGARTPKELLAVIDAEENRKYPQEQNAEIVREAQNSYRILAVTACPTGIAHTYMAAEALEKAGAEMGYPLKAETNGSGGAKNILTRKEIDECDGIIIAADKNVEMSRFNGKPLIKTSVSNGINKPKELIERIISGNAPVYHSQSTANISDDEDESFGRKIYKHLMNGVSHMLAFVVGGGVLIALGFLIDSIAGNATLADGTANSSFGFTNPIAATLFWIGKAAFALMLPVLSGYIAQSIADRPGILPGFIGGVFASSGYTFNSLLSNQSLVGEDSAVSGFIGALFAGFIAGLVVNALKKLFSWLPQAMDGIKPVFIYPLLATLIMGLIMLVVNPVFGAVNSWVSNGLASLGEASKLLLSIVLAAMMAFDMGGPLNKAAYVFGTATLTDTVSGNEWIMAAVMIGGMIPPIAIAVSTSISKSRWNDEERKNGPVNYLMGLCFITEGAIPYAAADPIRVIPSCMIGSAVAGAITSLFNVSCPAPHGGIFTFIVCDNPIGYIVALAVGSLAGALMLSILKKNRKMI